MLRGWTSDEIKSSARWEFQIGFGRGYVEDTLDKPTINDEKQ